MKMPKSSYTLSSNSDHPGFTGSNKEIISLESLADPAVSAGYELVIWFADGNSC
jgi:hypothetical protein